MGIQPLGTSSGRLLKLLLFPSFCTSFRKIPFASLFYMIFCFISYMYIKLQGKKRQPFGTSFFMQAERSHFDHWLHVSKNSYALWLYAYFFMILYMYIALGQGQTAQFRAKIFMPTGRPHHYGHLLPVQKESLPSLTLYTSFHNLIKYIAMGQGQTTPGDKSLMSTETACHFGQFPKISLRSPILYFLFSWFYTCIYPLGRCRQPPPPPPPPGYKVLMSTQMSCHFIHLLQVWFYTIFFMI